MNKSQPKIPPPTFVESLKKIEEKAHTTPTLKLREIFKLLAGRGYAALLILFSLPFCFPITIPGFSTLFGLMLAFIGLRISLGKKLWWPKMILEKEIPSETLLKITSKTLQSFQSAKLKFFRPRLMFLSTNIVLHRLHGILIFFLGLLLSLPLPIPLTNMFAAFPLLCFGIGLLEDDGIFILLAYILALACFSAFLYLFLLGKEHLAAFFA